VPVVTILVPERRGKRASEQDDEQLLHKANQLMMAISAHISRKESAVPVPDQPAPNTTRIFCDRIYAKLMSISDVRAREQLQYQLHSVVFRRKLNQ